jgi:transposase
VLVYEEDLSMTNTGCDIGKSNLDVFTGGKHSRFKNSKDGILKLILRIKELKDARVVLEPTGGYDTISHY